MSKSPKKTRSGRRFQDSIERFISKEYPYLKVYRQVTIGKSIIGKNRCLDILIVSEFQQAVGVEAKYQGTVGTADEKIHYALEDCASMWFPVVVAYGGLGWSNGVRHVLESSRHAVFCEFDEGTGDIVSAPELDAFLAATLGLWDSFLMEKLGGGNLVG